MPQNEIVFVRAPCWKGNLKRMNFYELLVTKTEFHTAKNETSKVPVLKKVFILFLQGKDFQKYSPNKGR